MKWNRSPKTWQLQEAKAKFSEVYQKALTEGPQYVTRRGTDEVVVSRRSDFERSNNLPHIVDILLAAPTASDFKIRRTGSLGRKPLKLD